MNTDDILGNLIDSAGGGDLSSLHDFYFYEPWDVGRRPEWMIEMAEQDGVDLRGGDIGRCCGSDPHPFQTGYHMSMAALRALVAGNMLGKSWAALCEDIMCLTGEIPFSMRFQEGADTGIKRRITPNNVLRWGRWADGQLLDFNPSVRADGSWDCGNIIGVGVFNHEKILNPGEESWLGTTLKAKQSYWDTKLDPASPRCMIPPHFFDTRRHRTGYDRENGILYMSRGTILRTITYETGYNRFEAGQDTRRITLDEEPTDHRIFSAAIQRAPRLTLVMTPYNGITYTRAYVFPTRPKKTIDTFHACQYDSPYRPRAEVDKSRSLLPEWERGARIWGVYSEQRGRPYYDRVKINAWIQRYQTPYDRCVFVAARQYFGVLKNSAVTELPGLMDVPVVKCPVADEATDCWSIYQDVMEGIPYVACADTASGEENPEDQSDVSACGIARMDVDRPIVVASIRTKRPATEFAENVLLACRYYNNALLAAESWKRGATNATFYHEAKMWPWWFKMAVTNDASGRLRDIAGFDTNSKTRDMIFDLIGEWINSFRPDEYPMIPDQPLLKELAGCVRGRNGRPDHSSDGTLDSAVWFGILLYVWKYARNQVTFNGEVQVKESKIRRAIALGKAQMIPRTLSIPRSLDR